jgi:hypothetical protein
MVVKITLTTAGVDTGPFNIFSNSDGYATPIVTGIAKSSLIAGYDVLSVPDDATIMRVRSTGTCTNQIDIPITVTYVMVLGTDYDFLASACTQPTTPTKTVTYTGPLAVGTILNGLTYSGDVGFMKIISSTEPGFTKVGQVINSIGSNETVYAIQLCS